MSAFDPDDLPPEPPFPAIGIATLLTGLDDAIVGLSAEVQRLSSLLQDAVEQIEKRDKRIVELEALNDALLYGEHWSEPDDRDA